LERRTKIILGISIGASLILTTLLIYFAKRNKVKVKNKNPKRILIVGDSQSAIKDASGNRITYTYPNLLQKDLASKDITIDVLALGGKTTDWMKTNLPSQLANNKYDRVIIYGGGNDTSNASIPLETTLSNIQQMVDMSRNNGADAFVNLGWKVQGDFGNYRIMPLTPYLDKQEDWIPYVEKRKQLQKLLPQKIQNANFIQPYDLQSLTKDGIHPTAEGHKIVAEKIKQSILND
jgi:lysophospholipase L1-like esterase